MTHSQVSLKKDARLTGFFYLSLAISGVLGFLIFHPKIFIVGEPASTLQNILDNESADRKSVV